MNSISDNAKKRDRPTTTGTGDLIGVRVLPELMAALDTWIARQPVPKPSRPEAIRRLAQMSLEGSQSAPTQGQDIAEELLANSTRPRFSIDDVE